MELPYLLSLVSPRLRDRARAIAFFRFLGRRFLDDELFQAAGALSFTTLFALVPLSMVLFGVLSAFDSLRPLSRQLADYVFANYVPGVARAAQDYLLQTAAANTGKLTSTGVVALVVSVLVTLTSIETTFNNIWRVKAARPKFGRFLVYWTVLTLGAVFGAASLAASARFFALGLFATRAGHALESVMLQLTPLALEAAAFATMYRVVPHRTVKWRHALPGAVLAMFGFEMAKWAMGWYLGSFNSYARIYQQLAIIPIFLLWVYVGWVAILLGASFAASLSAFRYQPVSQRLPPGYEIYGLLRMLARFDQARATGHGLHADGILRMESMLTDALVQQMLAQLCAINVCDAPKTANGCSRAISISSRSPNSTKPATCAFRSPKRTCRVGTTRSARRSCARSTTCASRSATCSSVASAPSGQEMRHEPPIPPVARRARPRGLQRAGRRRLRPSHLPSPRRRGSRLHRSPIASIRNCRSILSTAGATTSRSIAAAGSS